jgi:hypothetical protein
MELDRSENSERHETCDTRGERVPPGTGLVDKVFMEELTLLLSSNEILELFHTQRRQNRLRTVLVRNVGFMVCFGRDQHC